MEVKDGTIDNVVETEEDFSMGDMPDLKFQTTVEYVESGVSKRGKDAIARNMADSGAYIHKNKDVIDESKDKQYNSELKDLESELLGIEKEIKNSFFLGRHEDHYTAVNKLITSMLGKISETVKDTYVRKVNFSIEDKALDKRIEEIAAKRDKYEVLNVKAEEQFSHYNSQVGTLQQKIVEDNIVMQGYNKSAEELYAEKERLKSEQSNAYGKDDTKEAHKIGKEMKEITNDIAIFTKKRNYIANGIKTDTSKLARKKVNLRKAEILTNKYSEYRDELSLIHDYFVDLRDDREKCGTPIELVDGEMTIKYVNEIAENIDSIYIKELGALTRMNNLKPNSGYTPSQNLINKSDDAGKKAISTSNNNFYTAANLAQMVEKEMYK